MGLMKKLLGGKAKGQPSQFEESQVATALEQTKSRNAPRRELVQLTLRETMRRHGIPTDWIDCRTLSVLTKHHKSGLHVQFLVRKADHQILPWLHAFQEGFWEQVLRTDPTAHDWLFSVGWEFYGKSEQGFAQLPGADAWKQESDTQTMEHEEGDGGASGDTPHGEDDDIATDLQRLQDLITRPAGLTRTPDTPLTSRKS